MPLRVTPVAPSSERLFCQYTEISAVSANSTYEITKQQTPPSMAAPDETKFKIDAKRLAEDLRRQIEEDKLYWIRNDAKIRASTTSKNYDEFRDIVAAAHLKPLDRRDKASRANVGWNKCVATARDAQSDEDVE